MREKITSIVFVLILGVFFVLVMVWPKDEQASVKENRPLAEMPEFSVNSLFESEFCPAYENYLTDNVGFRSTLVDIGTKIEKIRGIELKSKGKIVVLPSGSRLALNDGKIMEIYQDVPEMTEQYARVLNTYSAKFSDKSDLYLMLAPTQIEFDKSEYRLLSGSEKAAIDRIYGSLNNIKTADVYSKLKENINQYVYFRTDHHWTQRGAYLGYKSIMEQKGVEPVKPEDMKVTKYSGFLGYLYNQANDGSYAEYADDIEVFECNNNYDFKVKMLENGEMIEYASAVYLHPAQGAVPTYGIFMGGDHAFAKIDTNVKNGQVALVIKDSYANTVIPFLTNHYETILVIDPRSFYSTVTELYNEYDIDDIIFINYIFTPTFTESVNNLEKILE